MDNNLCVAAYARVSTEHDDQINSLASQKSYFTNYIRKQQGMQLYKVYYDEGISGTQTRKRAGFNQMIRDAQMGRLDLILTKEVSRFARNTIDTLYYTRKLREAGVGVIFTIDNIDTRDADGELRLTIMASLAQEESRKISERVKWGQKRRMEQGVVFGRDLLGYTVKDGALSINEKEAPVVKAIFQKYTNEGKGTHSIAKELSQEGFYPKYMKQWSHTVILRILHNEKYVGDLCQKKTCTLDYLTHKKQYNHGQEEKVYIKEHHEGIIDRALWNRTQEELKKRSICAEQKKRHSNRYWCSSRIHCSECGSHYVSRTKKTQSGTYRIWQCLERSRNGIPKFRQGQQIGCRNHSIHESVLCVCVKYCIELLCDDKERLQKEVFAALQNAIDIKEKPVDTDRLTWKIRSIEEKKRKAFDAMLDGILSKADLQKQTEWYDKELSGLEHLLLQSRQDDRSSHEDKKRREQVTEALDQIFTFENEMLYREILEKIVVYPEEECGCSCLAVWFKELPFGIQLRIHATCRGMHYQSEIIRVSVLQ